MLYECKGGLNPYLLFAIARQESALNPSAVVMLMGTNDLEEQAEPEVIAGNFKLIIEALKKHNPKLPIVVTPSFLATDRPIASSINTGH